MTQAILYTRLAGPRGPLGIASIGTTRVRATRSGHVRSWDYRDYLWQGLSNFSHGAAIKGTEVLTYGERAPHMLSSKTPLIVLVQRTV